MSNSFNEEVKSTLKRTVTQKIVKHEVVSKRLISSQ